MGERVVCCAGKASLEMQMAQKIALLVMRRSKRSASDFPCSDECKRTLSEGACNCAEGMSCVIEDRKAHTI